MNRPRTTTRTTARGGRARHGSTGRGRRAAGSPPSPAARRRPAARGRGFTLIELMVVIVVLAILVALLLPAINSAVRTSRNAAVQAEINQIAQALENFKSKYGDYPPSRVLLVENGNYSTYIGNTQSLHTIDPSSPGTGDITVGQLASRTITSFRKFWPRVQLGTAGNAPPNITTSYWYDFNGNGVVDNPYILHGHECLVFFLGGVPLLDNSTGSYGLTGFGQDPQNPFSNMMVNNSMYNQNRQQPYFEFSPGRLFVDPSNTSMNGANPGIPGYYDSLNSSAPQAITGSGPVNFYAYFSAYGNGNYDPNDVNILETDQNEQGPVELHFYVNFPLLGGPTPPIALSASPNPYSSTLTVGSSNGTVTYQKPQTYQIISAGVDGLYGVGGQYIQSTNQTAQPLPFDSTNTYNGGTSSVESDQSVRQREYDNLTNFKSGTLQ